jgi:hypothetical protein
MLLVHLAPHRSAAVFLGLALSLVPLLGCGSAVGSDPPKVPDSAGAFGDRCDEKSVTQQPDLMGLSMDFRANVAVSRQQGVLAVRYAAKGCQVSLELLPNCHAAGRYEFSPYAGNESRIASSKEELFVKLPLGAVELAGQLAQGRSLRTDYRLAGMWTLPAGRSFGHSDLAGQDCQRATHVVNRIYIGGFALAVGESKAIQAAATIFGAGAGGGVESAGQLLASEGIAEQCVEAQRAGKFSELCQAPLRLGLLAIADLDRTAYQPDANGLVPLLVVDPHGCRANEEAWNGSRCESVSPPQEPLRDLLFRDEHGCVVGQEVFRAGQCLKATGTELYDSLKFDR